MAYQEPGADDARAQLKQHIQDNPSLLDDPALVDQLTSLGIFDDEMALLKKRHQALKAAPMPEGQMVSGHYVAPNPLASLTAGLSQIQTKRQQSQLFEDERRLIAEKKGGRGAYLRALLNRASANATTPVSPKPHDSVNEPDNLTRLRRLLEEDPETLY